MEFSEIYKKYYRSVWYYCNKIFMSIRAVDHSELAEDITEEAFIKAYKQWSGFKSEDNVRRFVFLVAKNMSINKLAEIKRRQKDHKDILFLSSEIDTVDYTMIEADVIDFILSEIDKLPPCQACVVRLFFAGIDSNSIADKLHITRKTALNQKLEAIGKIKKKVLKRYG